MSHWIDRLPYLAFVLLIAVGTYILIAHRNLVKAVVGLYLLQTGIILFFILLGARDGGTVPILEGYKAPAAEATPTMNPLPHALMLTAIVVGVAVTGVALAILRQEERENATVDDDEDDGERAGEERA